MSDEHLRVLERAALAAGDSESWRAYYRERERLGLRLPSGARSTVVSAPMGCVLTHVQFVKPPLTGEALIHDVELEWRRCCSGVAVEVYDAQAPVRYRPDVDHPQIAYMTAPWRDALLYISLRDFAPRSDNTTIPHDWVARPDSGPRARFCRGCRTLDTHSTLESGCRPEPLGLSVAKLALASAHVTFPEFLPDPMIMVRFANPGRIFTRAQQEAARNPGVVETIQRARPTSEMPTYQLPAVWGLTTLPAAPESAQRQPGESHRQHRRRLRRGGR